MSQQFKEPILSSIYKVACFIVLVFGLLGSVLSLLLGSSGLLPALAGIGITLLLALPLFGIAQLISYIGKTAYYSELISNSLTTSTYQTSKTLSEILHRLQTPSARDEATSPTPPSLVGAICPYCNAKIPSSSVRKGENICPECKNSFIAE